MVSMPALITIIGAESKWWSCKKYIALQNMFIKVHIFWEGHNILRNLHSRFVLCSDSRIYGGDFAKFCGLLRIYEPNISDFLRNHSLLKMKTPDMPLKLNDILF